MASPKIVSEYAKSNQSSCNTCSKTIPENSLILGLVSRDPGGFDVTKWHHFECLQTDSLPIAAAEEIEGFSSLKECDQEALKKLKAGSDAVLKVIDESGIGGSEERMPKQVHERDEDPGDESELSEESELTNLKKTKLSGTEKEADLEIVFSSNDVKSTYKDSTLPPKWKSFQTFIFLEQDDGLYASEKIAAFGFDGCLANTYLRRVGPDAWSLLYQSIPEKLQSLYNDGYKLVIFTNDSIIARWKNKRQIAVDSKIGRLNNFINCVKVPIQKLLENIIKVLNGMQSLQVFIACGLWKSKGQPDDPFCKPKPGLWRIMEKHFNSGIPVDMAQSFYVGGQAGRINDNCDLDIKFAEAVGLKFYLPEEYFGA